MLITGLLGFVFLIVFFWSALHGTDLHQQGLEVRENPLQKLLWKLAGRWVGYLFALYILECLLAGIGALIANGLGAIPGAIYFGAALAATIILWPKPVTKKL